MPICNLETAQKPQESEYAPILESLRNTIQAMADENKLLLDTVKFYGYTDWKTIALVDRGEKAREVYQHCNGVNGGQKG